MLIVLRRRNQSDLLFYSHPGIIAGLLARSTENVEQAGLARIWITHESYSNGLSGCNL